MRREASTRGGAGGFSLIELMISLLFVTIGMLALLEGFAHGVKIYALSRRHWAASLELWNRSRELRGDLRAGREEVFPLPHSRPMFRTELESDQAVGSISWEVLDADR